MSVKPKEYKEGSFLEVFRYKDLLVQLVKRDIKLKYRRSFLGYVWSILNPLLIMIIMAIVFSFLFKREITLFPIYLLAGRSMFEFINTAVTKSLSAITDNASLLKKTYVSKFMFPLAKITSSMVDFVFSMGALVVVMIVFSVAEGRVLFSLQNLGIIIVVTEAYIFALGLGFLMAQLHVFFRDIRYIYNAVSTMVLYCSAIFYDVGMFFEKAKDQVAAGSAPLALYLANFIEYLNPFYIYIKQFRYFIWTPGLETIPQWAVVTPVDFLLGFGYAILMFVIGVFFFRRAQNKFILYI
ncbi:MAG: ABC transporter permease [Ruminiclostridium sp.]|nr:ABC transporter permease [Ruminiclostridium sp.]